MEEKIKNPMVAELLWTEEEIDDLMLQGTINKVKRVMKDQELPEEAAINLVLFGVV